MTALPPDPALGQAGRRGEGWLARRCSRFVRIRHISGSVAAEAPAGGAAFPPGVPSKVIGAELAEKGAAAR
jgi:hypothetical protein